MSKVIDGILGAIVGDALGVPVEFKDREYLNMNPVVDMMEYGTWRQPIGTWSDDTSLILASMDGINHHESGDKIMNRFCNWAYSGKYTAHGEIFDIGNTTIAALRNFKVTKNINRCGLDNVESNGNGSLMRILPIALAYSGSSEDIIIEKSMEASSWTHGHIISKLCCAYYSLVVSHICKGVELWKSFELANTAIISRFGEVEELCGVFDDRVVPRAYIRSSGYVVHSLEVAKWSMLTSKDYREAVLKAINLGEDTDTNGAITGGLAGIYFGNIPMEWVSKLQNMALIDKILHTFDKKVSIQ